MAGRENWAGDTAVMYDDHFTFSKNSDAVVQIIKRPNAWREERFA